MITISATTDLATTEVFHLSGKVRIRADDLAGGDTVTFYEERLDGEYEPVRGWSGSHGTLNLWRHSVLFEGIGNYKAVISRAGITVGYDDGGIS